MKLTRYRVWMAGLGLAVIMLLASVAATAPILRKNKPLPTKVRSLAGIKQFRLGIEPVVHHLELVGITPNSLEARCTKLFAETNLRIVSDGNAPIVKLRILYVTESSLRNAFGFSIRLSLIQSMTVDRLGESMSLESYSLQSVGIDELKNRRKILLETVDQLVKRFILSVDRATMTRENLEAVDDR